MLEGKSYLLFVVAGRLGAGPTLTPVLVAFSLLQLLATTTMPLMALIHPTWVDWLDISVDMTSTEPK